MSLEVSSESQLASFAKRFAKVHQPGDILLLEGEIGAGKTTYTRYLCQALGVKGDITSPTFTLVQDYDGQFPVSHIDLYRLEDEEALTSIDIMHYLQNNTRLVCVEWAEKLGSFFPVEYIKLRFSYPKDDEGITERRFLDCEWKGESYSRFQSLWDELNTSLVSVKHVNFKKK